jgi:glycine dehydrogenase subunit 1
MNYIPVTDKDRAAMLAAIGVKDVADLYRTIPEKAQVKGLNLPAGISEQRLVRTMEELSKKNASLKEYASYRGAGVYEHFIPSLVDEIVNRSEFSTAYTPYQPEASQGTLQAVFEYQSLITALTGLDIANASLYDGASAVAEAALLAIRTTGRKKIVLSGGLNPEYVKVVRTYLTGSDVELVTVALKNGATPAAEVTAAVEGAAAVVIQSPNFIGVVEDCAAFAGPAHSAGAMLITVVNPLSLGILQSPAETGADIAVGEGQVLGNASGFGGFGFGFFACRKELAWKMPGRIVGQTIDTQNRRGYVLTLQSREQHIRREKATSNICTNAALNALAGCVYLAGWGTEGLKSLAAVNVANSHYAFDRITSIKGFSAAIPNAPFFNEFVVRTTKDIPALEQQLLDNKIIGPLALRGLVTGYDDCLLFCVTETKTKEDIDTLVNVLSA